ncbi:flagellar hook-associated protein FlgL [Atopococcus tabaci]|uniref:flagellar hook-associated protein FlgL n=1 Tax=Atopococcus tabaci TaxID=269774 RepID=UPI00040E6667|nr:flagellar hook-associated protein FlgL [Atopococcus tabaci]
MRVTSSLMSKSYLRNLNHNTNKVLKYQEQLSSLKEVNRPSDDPITVSKIMDLNNSITQNEQYETTIDDAIDWTNVQDSALANATNSMQRVRTLVQSAANGTMNTEDRKAVKAEVEAEIGTLVDSLNTSFGGRYVFAGANTTDAPFSIEKDVNGEFQGISYYGTDTNLPREIAPGVTVELKTDGNQLMNDQGNGNIGDYFKEVLTALDEDDTEALGGHLLERADQEFNNIVNTRTEIGAIFNRLESARERNESESLNLQEMLSSKQDVDMAEKFMQYSMEMVAYKASLQIGTKILQTNLLNYL